MAKDSNDVKTQELPGVMLSDAEKLAVLSAIDASIAMRTRARQKEVVGSELYGYYSRAIADLQSLKEKFK